MSNTENDHKPGDCLDVFCIQCYPYRERDPLPRAGDYPRCGSVATWGDVCRLGRRHSGLHLSDDGRLWVSGPGRMRRDGSWDHSWAGQMQAGADAAAALPTLGDDVKVIPRATLLAAVRLLGVNPADTDRIVIESDVVTVYGRPGTVPLVLPVVGA